MPPVPRSSGQSGHSYARLCNGFLLTPSHFAALAYDLRSGSRKSPYYVGVSSQTWLVHKNGARAHIRNSTCESGLAPERQCTSNFTKRLVNRDKHTQAK